MTLPQGFLDMLAATEFAPFDGLGDTLACSPPVTAVRVSRTKPVVVPGDVRGVPWCPRGFILPYRPSFTLDPAMHQGAYYVQDPSSMFIGHVLRHLTRDTAPVSYLDACAAPGGKTTCAIDALPPGSVVTANEAVPARASVLRENLLKWGYPSVTVTRADARSFARTGIKWDIVAADVPCSGEGMMRKEPVAVSQWSMGLVRECAAMQRDIVSSLWEVVRPGGYLIYSTCTFNTVENEDVLRHLVDALGAEPVGLPVDPEWGIAPGIDTDIPCYRFIPGHVEGEGLFMAVLRKPGDFKIRPGKPPRRARIDPAVSSWLADAGSMSLEYSSDGRVTAFPAIHAWLPAALASCRGIDVIQRGVTIGVAKGRDILPSHSLAMSSVLAPDAFPRIDVETSVALDYLRGNAVILPDAPCGHVLLIHAGLPLGFVKNLGSRANNLYPREYRIRCL